MTPAEFLVRIVDPGLAVLSRCSKITPSDPARVMLVAIGGQESGLIVRRQQPDNGPARGWYQFESGGGVAGVLTHAASKEPAQGLCDRLIVPCDQATVYEAIAWCDPLATGFARLLLYTDAAALPSLGKEQAAWDYYLRNWRPGKPHPETWHTHYAAAVHAVQRRPL